MIHASIFPATAAAVLLLATPGWASDRRSTPVVSSPVMWAVASLISLQGKDVGTATLSQRRPGVRFELALKGLPPGEHGFHITAVGRCEPPFTSAGPHFNPAGKKHGLRATDGHHAGDMWNLIIPSSGKLKQVAWNNEVTLDKDRPHSLLRDGGTAIVITAGPDDHLTEPHGNAGARIACGVIVERGVAVATQRGMTTQ
jgi:superoxide dismutase, Cu-Zn family